MFNGIRSKFEANKVAVWAVIFAAMLFLNNAGTEKEPFAAALYYALLLSGEGVMVSSVVYGMSFALSLKPPLLVAVSANILISAAIYGTFGKKKRLGIASLAFLPASLIPYILISGSGNYAGSAIAVAVITMLAAAFYPGVYAVKTKGFRRPEAVEAFSLALLYTCVWLGGIKYIGRDAYKAFSVFSLACVATLLSGKESMLFAVVFAAPLAINFRSAAEFVPYLVFGAVSYAFGKHHRLVYTAMMLAAELACAYVFGFYGNYGYISLIWFSAALLAFAPMPAKFFEKGEIMLALSSDKPLSRYCVNRTRSLVSGRLYEISGTFHEIADLFTAISEKEDPFVYENAVIGEINKLCEDCSYSAKCRATSFPKREELARLVSIAKGKGRISAVDLPKSFSLKCSQSGKVIYVINKYVGAYAAEMDRKKAVNETRALVSAEAEGVAAALKSIARTLSKQLSFEPVKEAKLCAFLLKKGVNVQEAIIFGEGDGAEISLTVTSSVTEKRTVAGVNEFFKTKFCVTERYDLPGGRTVLTLEKACKYDCAFGVATLKKDGAETSGDTHSLIKLMRNKFILALSDGMGSGEAARATSEASLSLVECLYRAGLPGGTALSTVNELLSFTGEENFAALDLAYINLEGLSCDFIKFGAPYGFIISSGAVKTIEGSSLPVGILKEMKPAVCSERVSPGDVILFMSDGVTDAFGSSTDFADYLSAVSVANPQKLADKILNEAFALYGNKASDDMTVVACKIFAA
ncbi:MAG: SpoIIE family protein phosphatase [Clostridia bacterium]|nr:SpoIIE family protein phosphatase [Clostridia bacterium]